MTPPIRPKARDDLAVVEIDGEAVVYDTERKRLHHLNPTATMVFASLGGEATVRELAGELSEAYGLPAASLEPQLRGLLRRFRSQGLLQPDAS